MKTLKFKLRKINKQQYKILFDFCHYSNNLYNSCIYICKKHFEETNKYIGIAELRNQIKNNENYKLLPAQVSQQIIKLVDKNYRSFFVLLKRKNKGEYCDKINSPFFKKRGSMFNLIYPNQSARISKGTLTFNTSNEYKKINNCKLKIPFTYNINGNFKQIVIKPIGTKYFNCYIHYEENKKEEIKLDKRKYIGIDLGLNNLASCVDTNGHSFILNGKSIKSFNIWYNKTKSKLQSELKIKNNKYWSNRLTKLEEQRYWFIDNYFNQCVNKIIKYCLINKIGNVVIGYNETWKQNINLGKVNNQKFVYIPFYKFKQKLESKCFENNIKFFLQEESYTSKCSAIDLEEMKQKDCYAGKRVKRGLFVSKNGKKLNADINGAVNILRKVIGDAFISQPIVGLMLNPVKLEII